MVSTFLDTPEGSGVGGGRGLNTMTRVVEVCLFQVDKLNGLSATLLQQYTISLVSYLPETFSGLLLILQEYYWQAGRKKTH